MAEAVTSDLDHKTDEPRPVQRIIATWFGIGRVKRAPGTFGSLAALPFALALQIWFGNHVLGVAAILLFLVSLWAVGGYLKHSRLADPQDVVVDEVVGQWLALMFVPASVAAYIIGFACFRFFDIVKPWPVSWADRHVAGAFGVMLDDVLAGILASIVTFFLVAGVQQLWPGHI